MGRMLLTGSLLLALSTSVMASQVYKWVDDKGVTHFGAQPPQGQAATAVSTTVPQIKSVAPKLPSLDSGDAAQKAIDEKVKQDVAQKESERKQYCEQERTNLAQLRNNPRLRTTEENGEVRRLDENERQTRIQQAEKAIQENCD
ncbi:DUF4124 domain-containing protein [Pseudomonas sp. UL073]|uniref:DUF4124 domain-containing protein n=1 Tax=Zestomonas insulae TaxID=2809017 RepID=A0ABS2IL97_9GAMM|nr:DUF4124 domain-containing protein [Pseudomonas insulae]MBM7063149.1 DUF4124 domain-containing protein [Pseudomonas insulae]